MKHHLYTCEMMDDTILNCTKTNREQVKIDFIQGEPKAVIMMEVASYVGMEDAEKQADALIADLEKIILGMRCLKFMVQTLIK
jgi:hypothetical protein